MMNVKHTFPLWHRQNMWQLLNLRWSNASQCSACWHCSVCLQCDICACMVSMTEDTVPMACAHQFCKSCWQTWVTKYCYNWLNGNYIYFFSSLGFSHLLGLPEWLLISFFHFVLSSTSSSFNPHFPYISSTRVFPPGFLSSSPSLSRYWCI